MITFEIDITNDRALLSSFNESEITYIYYKTNNFILVTCDKDLCEGFLNFVGHYNVIVKPLYRH